MNPTWDETEEVKQPVQAAPTWDETTEAPSGNYPHQVGAYLKGMASNAPGNAGEMIQNTARLAGNLVTHPIDTTVGVVKGLPDALKGLAGEWGVPEALHGKFGDAMDKVMGSFYHHPVDRAMDVASVALPALKGAGVLGEGIKGSELASRAAELGEGVSKAADARWTRAVGGTIQNAQELTKELGPLEGPAEFRRLGRTARNEGVVTPWNGIDTQAQKVAEMNAEAGKEIGDLRAVSDIQGDAPRVSDMLNRVRGDVGPKYTPDISTETGDFERAMNKAQRLEPLDKLEPSEELQGAMQDATRLGDRTSDPMGVYPHKGNLPIDDYEEFRRMQEDPNYIPEISVQRPTTHSEIAKTVTDLNHDAATKSKLLQASGATTDVANTLAKMNDESIMRALTPEQGSRYKAALQRYGDSEKLERMVGQKASYEAGASRNSISNNLVNRFQQRFGYQLTAAGMDKLASFLKTNPERFGKYAGVLNHALSEGPAAFATTYHLIAEKDPQFAQELSSAGAQQ